MVDVLVVYIASGVVHRSAAHHVGAHVDGVCGHAGKIDRSRSRDGDRRPRVAAAGNSEVALEDVELAPVAHVGRHTGHAARAGKRDVERAVVGKEGRRARRAEIDRVGDHELALRVGRRKNEKGESNEERDVRSGRSAVRKCTAGEFMKVELALKTRLPFFHRPPPLALRVLPVPRVRPGQVVQSSVRRPLMLVVLVTLS